MPILKSTKTPPPTSKPPTKPGQPTKPSNAPKRDAFAEKLAQTESSAGGQWTPPPVGTYNALVTEAQGVVDDQKTSAYFEFTIVDHEELAGKTCRIYFNFTNEDGEEMQGMPYFRQALEMFGINVDETVMSWDAMCEAIAGVAEQNMWGVISVKKKGKFTNIFLDSVPENQDEKPALPE